jgi:hypothetical protein
MQNALIQDGALAADPEPNVTCPATALGAGNPSPPSRVGLNSRVVRIDLKAGTSKQYVYTIDAINQGRGQNDLLAINDHELLVLERDNRTLKPTPPNTAATPNEKRLYRIDLNEAGLTDVSGTFNLPGTVAGLTTNNIKGVAKHLFLDLLNPAYVVDASTTPPTTIKDVIAEKVEGVAWGPDLPDGRHLLLVTTDNDLFTGDASHDALPTQVYAFAIKGDEAGIDYVPQSMKGPFFPPGQVKKIVGK